MNTCYVKEHRCKSCFWLLKKWTDSPGEFSSAENFRHLLGEGLINEYKRCPKCGGGVATDMKEQKHLNFWR
jgi:hypothetical protein